MLTVWGRKTSSNVQALMWCIGELGLPYQRHDVGHKFGGTDTEAFSRLNPNRTVPVLQDDLNPPLWETGCILRYLANRYADEMFWPAELIARTEVDRWAEWSKINIALGFTTPVFWRVVRTPAEHHDSAAIRNAVSALEEKLVIADTRLRAYPYLVRDAFSLADIQFGHILYRYYDIDIERADLPNLADYYARLAERPAFREHVMISYEDLRI
jgi:glutathione S-transferase